MTRLVPALRCRWQRAAAAALGLSLAACVDSTDSLGADRLGPTPSTFEEVIGVTPAEVAAKLSLGYEQLFHGDPENEAILYPADGGGAYVFDVLHGEIRTDGLGYGMLLAALLDRQDDFDALWSYARESLRYTTGPRAGYLYWHCSVGECPDPNGMTYAATALLFADRRWGTGAHDYAGDSRALRDAMLHREAANGGIVDDVHDMFDDESGLVVTSPLGDGALTTTPGFITPAFYDLWAATGPDSASWAHSARAAREFLPRIADADTGLTPEQTTLTGAFHLPYFGVDAYRVGLNLAIDVAWNGGTPETRAVLDRLVEFFASSAPLLPFGEYETNGTPRVNWQSTALAAMNGAAASRASSPQRVALVEAVWNLPIPSGNSRYYDGVLYLVALATLSGAMTPP